MPGITGIISKILPERNEEDLRYMVEWMMHESFYKSGMYINSQLGLYVGWVCHQGSFSDCMPVFNEKKDLILIFTGENFIDNDLIDQLKRQGHEFNPSNASYLIHLYEENENGFFQHLNGLFNGILVDLRKSKIILFNDRYGMQRIYYYESKDIFYFSSEAKSLLKVRPELREIEMQGLAEFFSCGCVLENRTLFSNIFLLPGGSEWTFYNGKGIKKDFYFKPSTWENQPVLEKEIVYERLKNTFRHILPRYFDAKEPIGMSLTGGLDTRMIMANMNNQPGKLPCYTFGGMYRDSFDVKVARKVADACHQSHCVLHLSKEFLSDFPSYAEKTIYISDGSLDVCGSPELYMNRLAREISPIRMTGNYGSELLRSISSLKAISPNKMLFHSDFIKHIEEARKTFDNIYNRHILSFILFKQAPWYGYGRYAIEQSQLTLRMPFIDNNIVSLVYQAPVEARTTIEVSLRLIEDNNPKLFRIKTDRGMGGKSNFPFTNLIHLFYWFTLKAESSYSFGLPHWLTWLDTKFRFLYPKRSILGYHKFLHFRIWFRDELSTYVREILLDKQTTNRSYLNKKFLEEMVQEHIKGHRNYTNEINKIMTAELIQRLLIEQSQDFNSN